MKKVLVLGGTRFFGKRLVSKLIENGCDVTILTRGNSADPFGQNVKRIQANREETESLEKALGHAQWDIVYDNICYASQDAADAVKIFSGKTEKYMLTSTLSVYDYVDNEQPLREEDFDPYHYPIQLGRKNNFTYQEGKRAAEAVFFQQRSFPVTAVRFPIVLGPDDYTRRLHFHVEHVLNNQPIGTAHPEAKRTYIHSQEAAEFLYWAGTSELKGPVNACSLGEMSLAEIVALIEKETGKTAILERVTTPEHTSPFEVPSSWLMDVTKACSAGFPFWDLKEWMGKLISELAKEYR